MGSVPFSDGEAEIFLLFSLISGLISLLLGSSVPSMSDMQQSFFKQPNLSASASELATPESTDTSILSVEQLNGQIKRLLEGELGSIWVKGEISNFKAHTSGHFYFSLKDSKAQISAVMFRGHNSRLKFKPVDGLEVIVRGRITVYEPRGNYQIMCEMMEPVGAGALQKAFEQLRDKLKLEGLFDSARKRTIPSLPRHVAIVTSPTGAAIRDILNILSRRAQAVQVTVVPTLVQGSGAAPQIVEALKSVWRLPQVDVIIIGRGGGSIEDMWAFNDETLARAIAASPIPVISAVGHEIDFTIADFVADLRAPTPSAAAELVAKSTSELSNKISQLHRLLAVALDRKMKTLQQRWLGGSRRLVDPRKRLQDLALRNDDLTTRLELAARKIFSDRRHKAQLLHARLGRPMQVLFERKKSQAVRLMSVLDSLSPLKVVERGYSIVTKLDEVIKSYHQVRAGDVIQIRLAEGEISASVLVTKGTPDGL